MSTNIILIMHAMWRYFERLQYLSDFVDILNSAHIKHIEGIIGLVCIPNCERVLWLQYNVGKDTTNIA